MIMCKDGEFAYEGKTVEEAYQNYLKADNGFDMRNPTSLKWYRITEMRLDMTLTPVENKQAPKKKG